MQRIEEMVYVTLASCHALRVTYSDTHALVLDTQHGQETPLQFASYPPLPFPLLPPSSVPLPLWIQRDGQLIAASCGCIEAKPE